MREAQHRFDNAKRRRPDSHVRQAMLTPEYVLDPVRALLGGQIGLDPCTDPDNPTKAARFYCLPQDGCALPWDSENVFCNPPYGQARDRWVNRCIAEGRDRRVLLLIPAHTETKIFQAALASCTSVLFVRARLRFGVLRENRRQEAASHGSAIFGFGVDVAPLSMLGVVLDKKPRKVVIETLETLRRIAADPMKSLDSGRVIDAQRVDELCEDALMELRR